MSRFLLFLMVRVSFNNTTTISKVFLLPDAQNRFGQGQNGAYDPLHSELWGRAFDGSLKDFGTPLPDGTQPQNLYAAPESDNRLDLFQTGVNVQNDLSFSGGDENPTYFLSLQYVSIKGILPGDKSRRTGARFNGSKKFGKLNTSYIINYIKFSTDLAPDGPWLSAYTSPANIDFSEMKDWKNPSTHAHPLNYITDQVKNPFFPLDNFRQTASQNTVNGKIELDYEFAPWFSAIYRMGMYQVTEDTRNTTGKLEGPGRRNVNGSLTDGSNNFQRFNGDVILSFNRQLGDFTHRLLWGQYFRSDYTKTTTVGADNLLLPGIFNPDGRVGEFSSDSGSGSTEYSSLAVYGEFTTGYKNLLFLTLTGRNDWVSVLGKDNRSYFYPSLSTSFIFNEAIPALRESRNLTFGKIFASWNQTGNVTLNPYQLNNPFGQIKDQ